MPRRVSAAFAVLLVLALASTGCLATLQEKLRKTPPAHEPFHAGFDGLADPNLSKNVPFPVDDGAKQIVVSVSLGGSFAGNGLPTSPSQITVTVKDPSGAPVGAARMLSPQNPSAKFTITTFPRFGPYAVSLTGNGLSGQGNGATYSGTVDVTY